MAKKKRTGRLNDTISYVVEIRDWDWGFWFGINRLKHFEGPCRDFRHLHLFGNLLKPNNLKVDSVRLTFIPDAELNLGVRSGDKPQVIGSVQILKGKLEGWLSMPADALNPLLQMLIAGRLRYVVLDGEPLQYRQGSLHSYSLDMSIDEEELADSDSAVRDGVPAQA